MVVGAYAVPLVRNASEHGHGPSSMEDGAKLFSHNL